MRSSGRPARVRNTMRIAKNARPCTQRRLVFCRVHASSRAAVPEASRPQRTIRPHSEPTISSAMRILLSAIAWASLSGGREYACSERGWGAVAVGSCGFSGADPTWAATTALADIREIAIAAARASRGRIAIRSFGSRAILRQSSLPMFSSDTLQGPPPTQRMHKRQFQARTMVALLLAAVSCAPLAAQQSPSRMLASAKELAPGSSVLLDTMAGELQRAFTTLGKPVPNQKDADKLLPPYFLSYS